MASRAEQKEQRRQHRLAQEKAARERERRRCSIGVATAGVLVAASVAAIVVVVAAGGGGGGSGASSGAPFGTHYPGLQERREAAEVPTMSEAQSVGAVHFHPHLAVYVRGRKIQVPANIGIDPTKSPLDMAGLHTHDTSGTIHNEAGTSSKLGQFFAVWGVPFTSGRLGPYRASRSKKIRMWVDRKPSKEFGNLQLEDGQRIVVGYGTLAQMPLRPVRKAVSSEVK